MNKKNISTLILMSLALTICGFWGKCSARKFKSISRKVYAQENVAVPCLSKNVDFDAPKLPACKQIIKPKNRISESAVVVSKLPVGLDWTKTTTQNLETAVEYFFSVIPEEQEELRRSLKQKEHKTREKIRQTREIGDQNYRESEFLASKLAMVANWHKAAQEDLIAALQQKDESIGGVKYKDFKRVQKNAQKELLYEIYAMLDGAFPDPKKPVDQAKLDEKIQEVVLEVFQEFEKPKEKQQAAKKTTEKASGGVPSPKSQPVVATAPSLTTEEKDQQKESLELEIKIAKFKEELEVAKKTVDKCRLDNLKLKEDLEIERRKRAEENIRQKMEEKSFENAKNKLEKEKNELESRIKNQLEKEKSELESKISAIEKRRAQLEGKVQSLEDDVRKEATGKAIAGVELEKIRKQKEAAEQKLDKKKAQIADLEARLQENDRKQVELQIQVAKMERMRAQSRKKDMMDAKISVKAALEQKDAAKEALKTDSTESSSGKIDSLQQISNSAKRLDELNNQEIQSAKNTGVKELESLFADFAK